MSAQDIMFGRAVRFTCDRRGCNARQTTTGDQPDGWEFVEGVREWFCPKHVGDAEFDRLCDEMERDD
jgi:hypothetical protein